MNSLQAVERPVKAAPAHQWLTKFDSYGVAYVVLNGTTYQITKLIEFCEPEESITPDGVLGYQLLKPDGTALDVTIQEDGGWACDCAGGCGHVEALREALAYAGQLPAYRPGHSGQIPF